MVKIQKISSRLLIIFNALLVILPFWVFLQWLWIDNTFIQSIAAGLRGFSQAIVQTPEGVVNLNSVQWNVYSKFLGFISDAAGLWPLFIGLFSLKSVFCNYQNGEIFTIGNAHHYRRLGWLFFLDALLAQPLKNMLLILAVTFSNPPGHRYITVSFGLPNLEALFCGLLVIIISWVMLEASKLQEEQKLTI